MTRYENWAHLAYTGACATWPWTGLSTGFFIIRTISRIGLTKDTIASDDIIISISWIFNLVRQIGFQIGLHYTSKVTESNHVNTIPDAAFWAIFADAWSFFSISLPKMGVAILLCRIFRTQRWLKITFYTYCIGLDVLAFIGFIITYEQCHPVAGQWDPYKHPNAECWNRDTQTVYSCVVGAISASLDIIFSVYPGIVIWQLNMPNWKKFNTMLLMGLGVISFACAVKKLISSSELIGNNDPDTYLYHAINIGIWNGIENDFVLAAACLPSLPPFCRFIRGFVKTRILRRPVSKAGSERSEYAGFSNEISGRHPGSRSGKHHDNRDSFETVI